MAMSSLEPEVISHWYKLLENFQASPLEFYASVETALQPRKIPDASVSRVDWKEGGLVSARREYLRVQRGRLAFDICGAPFGTGFFFSWWLAKLPPSHALLYAFLIVILTFVLLGMFFKIFGFFLGLFLAVVSWPVIFWLLGKAVQQGKLGSEDDILGIPGVGWLYERLFNPNTYYKMDTALMFQESVRHVVDEVVERLTTAKGIRPLTDLERKPMLREFYRR